MAVQGLCMMRKWSRVAPRKYSFLLRFSLKIFKWHACTMRGSKSKSLSATKRIDPTGKKDSFWQDAKLSRSNPCTTGGRTLLRCNRQCAACSFCADCLKEGQPQSTSKKIKTHLRLQSCLMRRIPGIVRDGKTLQSTSQFRSAARYCYCIWRVSCTSASTSNRRGRLHSESHPSEVTVGKHGKRSRFLLQLLQENGEKIYICNSSYVGRNKFNLLLERLWNWGWK